MTTLLRALVAGLLAATLSLGAIAGPGAHGPDGEHLDGPAANNATASSRPRIEAASDQFELVATLGTKEFSMLIDRFATNEPVLGAQVEIESGGLKAKAAFQADMGSYAVADAAMLKLLGNPGDHALVFTIIDGNESDLLDATLKVAADEAHDSHGGEFLGGKVWIGTAVLATLLIGIAVWRRRTRTAKTRQGGQP
ncbi:hypothetical protein ASD88_22145 [Pelomonas sp. Root662]|nr:hypothetical protein ASC81_20565 [Pelomonas sp. Root405]KRA68366.1 hypothetical protein ASD88_22145 [Pelomonas sp. Root662]